MDTSNLPRSLAQAPADADRLPAQSEQLLTQIKRHLKDHWQALEPIASSAADSVVTLAVLAALVRIEQGGLLNKATKRRIALAIAEQQGCSAHLAAQQFLAESIGFPRAEIAANRAGSSWDARGEVAVAISLAILKGGGALTQDLKQRAKVAGFGAAELLEIGAHTSLALLLSSIGRLTEKPCAQIRGEVEL